MTPRAGIPLAAAPIVAVLLLAAGCAAGIAANKKSPGTIEKGAFKATVPPAAAYGPDPSSTCPGHGVTGIVESELGNQAKAEGRLCAVAETLLGWPGTDSDIPPENVLATVSNHVGLPQTVRKVVITNVTTAERVARGPSIEGASEQDLASMIEQPIRGFAAGAVAPRYGVATERVKAGLTRVVIVMQDQSLEIKPLPRMLNPGQTATLSGTVLGKLENPKVQFTDASGKLERGETKGGKEFSAELKCAERPGRMIVQITAQLEGADVLLANFPVGCGVDLPVAAAIPSGKQAGPADPVAAEKQLADLLNQDRNAVGLKPLHVDDDLAKVARSLSEDRAKGKGTTSQEVQRRLKEAEISAPTVLVSEAQALNAEDAWMRFTNSPADRANAMNPEVTDMGIGVVPGPPAGDRPQVIVTNLYLKQLPPPDAEEVKANLYKAIARRRSEARAAALAKDPQLEQIAQAYATQMAKDSGKVSKEKVAEIEGPLYKSFSTVNELGGVKADPLEFAEEPGIVGDARLVGVGVGVGTSPQFGKNSTYVVILVGKKHGPAKAPAATRQPVKKKK